MTIFTWEAGGDGLFSYAGSLDITGFAPFVIPSGSPIFNPSDNAFFAADGDIRYLSGAYPEAPSGSAGIGPEIALDTISGDFFGFNGLGQVLLPAGYVSETPISGTASVESVTFASLGLTTGTVVNTLTTADTIMWKIADAPTAIPLPAGLPLAAAGIAALAWLLRRKGS